MDTTFTQKICGKNLFAVISMTISLALMKMDKPGLTITEKGLKMIPMVLAILLQIMCRFIVFTCLIFHESALSSGKYWLFIVVHVSIMMAALFLFETNRTQRQDVPNEEEKASRINCECKPKVNAIVKFASKFNLTLVVRAFASLLILPSPDENNQQKKTIVSKIVYEILILVESLILTTALSTPDDITLLKEKAWIPIPLLVILFWLIANILQVNINHSHLLILHDLLCGSLPPFSEYFMINEVDNIRAENWSGFLADCIMIFAQ